MPVLIVVRRDASETFYRLKTTWIPKLGPDATLMWDRRTHARRGYDISGPVERQEPECRDMDVKSLDDGAEARRRDRRQQCEWRMPERRHTERRRRAADTWDTLGFLVVDSERESP
jgi:hypothetical protein